LSTAVTRLPEVRRSDAQACVGVGGAAVLCALVAVGCGGGVDALRKVHGRLGRSSTEIEYVENGNPAENDELLAGLPPGSLIVNATGMGKDVPGSPVTESARFPEKGVVWELNYRGELDFLRQARHQELARNLRVEDGWLYFLHGWSEAIAEVFHVELTPERFEMLSTEAEAIRS
jgi:shikimate 5-dehydrogenase